VGSRQVKEIDMSLNFAQLYLPPPGTLNEPVERLLEQYMMVMLTLSRTAVTNFMAAVYAGTWTPVNANLLKTPAEIRTLWGSGPSAEWLAFPPDEQTIIGNMTNNLLNGGLTHMPLVGRRQWLCNASGVA
jgi:hypothetical protein